MYVYDAGIFIAGYYFINIDHNFAQLLDLRLSVTD